ncbi:MAG: DUF4167 domain-containing protein [Caulobacteraceae bacterium]
MKRQRGRSRNSGGGGGKPQHNTNRAFDSNGPEGVKVRGAAQNVYEKYQQLARDAHTAGDRVLGENHLQHAEHYFRLIRAMQPQRPLSEIIGRDQFVSGYDIDFEDESGANEAVEPDAGASGGGESAGERAERAEDRRDERPREDYRPGDQRTRDDRARNDRPQYDRGPGDRGANERPQNERQQNDRQQNDRFPPDRADRGPRDERGAYNRDDRPERIQRDPLTVVEPEATPLTPAPAATSVLRADDGAVNHAPAFLQVRPVEPRTEATGESRRPPRRRAPRRFEGADATADPVTAEE